MNLAALPLLIIAASCLLVFIPSMLPGAAVRRSGPPLVAVAGLLATGIASLFFWGDRQYTFWAAYRVDRLTVLVTVALVLVAIAAVLLSLREPAGTDRRAEYYCLLLSATAGMILVAGASDLIGIFLGIEILSIALYVLCALAVWRERSLEAGLKYLIVGAVGSALLLYGLAFLFGATGTTDLGAIAEAILIRDLAGESLLIGAAALIIAGLGFKVAAAPFHMWAPDVYEGAPTPVTTFMATAVKIAAFTAFLRIFGAALLDVIDTWQLAIAVVAAMAIIIGNVGALVQDSFKRMLAYSSVAQAGYLLVGVAAGTIGGARALLFYLLAYSVMTIGAFAIIVAREREVQDAESVAALRGYARRSPVMGVVTTISLLSLAGFPPLAGFIGKFMLFAAAVDTNLVWLAVIGAIGSVISLGYYLRPIAVMWADEMPADQKRVLNPGLGVTGTTAVTGVVLIALTIAAGPVAEYCRLAAEALIAP